ncbi:MAG: AAA family ATPase, partial [Lachnospiraceae bacterium]|nr:AAA family ATPase [Lachnospiraceae bacterium]
VFYDLRKRMAVDVASRGSLLSQAERPEVRFADVIGAESAKKELRYFVEYLKNPKYFLSKGEKPPKGILLYGPPGTGKTMLAKAMAGESDVTFLQTTAAEFLNSSVGKGEEKIREAFRRAQKYAPAIIFIDEIDTIGKRRTGAGMTESMLNTLLTQMDGFATDRRKPVFVLAATNYGISGEGAAVLDEALLRRFDNKIYISLPNLKERRQYLEQLFGVGAAGSRISESILDNIAERTTGQSLAELQNVAGLAMRSAVRDGVELSDEVLLTALEEYIHGEKKEHTAEYYYSVAIHEAGHAYVAWLSGDKPAYLTVESRGDFGGYMMAGTPDDTPAYTEEMLIGKIRTALAGRVAEEVFFGAEKGANTGAASDLEKATNLAFGMLCRYGLTGDRLVSLNKEEVMHSSLAGEYLEKANEILQREMQNTQQIIKDGRGTIERIAKELVEKNRLTGQEFETIMKQGKSRRAQVNKGKQRAL